MDDLDFFNKKRMFYTILLLPILLFFILDPFNFFFERNEYVENEYGTIMSYPSIDIEKKIDIVADEVMTLRGFGLIVDTCNIKYRIRAFAFDDLLTSGMYYLKKGGLGFSNYTEQGDRIIKNSGSDTLWLRKSNNEILIFQIQSEIK